MKRKRTKTNSLKFQYLPDDCWELIFKNMRIDDEDYHSLSLVSKQFLSITNRLRFSLTIKYCQTIQETLNLVRRFPNLTSLHLCGQGGDLDELLRQISTLSINLTSLKLYDLRTMPANGLLDFSQNIKTLTEVTCSKTEYLRTTHMFLIADCFPNLQLLDLNHCEDISQKGIYRVLYGCRNIRHLNLADCSGVKLHRMMKFQVLKLEVLNLSYSTVDDRTLNVITKSCTEILQLSLKFCDDVTYKGVKHVLQNCKQLKEINLNGVKDDTILSNLASMVLLRPSLRKITYGLGQCWVP
ncbi:unnamed protein product [Trifolium pratense]|uniref:Uncharacterized protein n=1 Tax=Trifolium pratense TaxID=57577 RepID=A0ACB0JXY4_TRIPR|nr:unnamed protein product [Trifolium pratense]